MDDDGIASRARDGESLPSGGDPPGEGLTRELVEQFVERNRRIDGLEQRVDELTRVLDQHRATLQGKDAELDAARVQVQTRDEELAALRVVLQERDAELSAAQVELQRRETALSAARLQVVNRDAQLARVEARLAQIKGSRVWHVAQVYWRLREWLAGRQDRPRRLR